MTTAKHTLTFNEYLTYDDGTDDRYELIDGELIALPPESEPNNRIVSYLFLQLISIGVPFRLVKLHVCEIQVPVLQRGDAQNRYPDLVVLREEHLSMTQKRLSILLDMPPPQMIVEVVSPGRRNWERDYDRKHAQYKQVGIPEYWIINPELRHVLVLQLEEGTYVELGTFQGSNPILSPTFPTLHLAPEQFFAVLEN